jgi:hypothetical protein
MSQVHHIDPNGQDAGVVYSEMQGRENTSSDLMNIRFAAIPPCLLISDLLLELSISLQRLLEPPGSAYRSETGGLMTALRVLTPEQSDDCPQTALASLIFFQFANTIRTTTSLII